MYTHFGRGSMRRAIASPLAHGDGAAQPASGLVCAGYHTAGLHSGEAGSGDARGPQRQALERQWLADKIRYGVA